MQADYECSQRLEQCKKGGRASKRKAEAAASWLPTQIIASNEDNNRAKTTEKREAQLAKWMRA